MSFEFIEEIVNLREWKQRVEEAGYRSSGSGAERMPQRGPRVTKETCGGAHRSCFKGVHKNYICFLMPLNISISSSFLAG